MWRHKAIGDLVVIVKVSQQFKVEWQNQSQIRIVGEHSAPELSGVLLSTLYFRIGIVAELMMDGYFAVLI